MQNNLDFKSIVGELIKILNGIVPILIGLALLLFIYGIVRYIAPEGEEDREKEGRNMMIYGIIGIFVMVSVWGLVAIVVNTFFQNGAQNTPVQSTYQDAQFTSPNNF